jgi:hypothetical protein
MKLDEQTASTSPGIEVARKAVLVLEDGTVFHGKGLGAFGQTLGEVCFNTSMTGYQEVLSDPSYAGQIITFTFPHIGNVGTNEEDIESRLTWCRGLVLREEMTPPASWRARGALSMVEGSQSHRDCRGRHTPSGRPHSQQRGSQGMPRLRLGRSLRHRASA